ncbi:MAG TPA: hypothetical protein VFR28_04885 [Allosphingosinicella sp.]|nr:hypothetical protein [Allosphingosinicella sp.]
MSLKLIVAAAVAAQGSLAAAQGTIIVPGSPAAKMPIEAAPAHPDGDDTPEEMAQEAAKDLKDSRFYNRPGATRADYDKDWNQCRKIARGSINPNGRAPMVHYYNPAVISPIAAGIAAGVGGLIGGMIAAKIEKDRLRRANRRACLMIRGWRVIEVDDAEKARVASLSDSDRDSYFNRIVGAASVQGEISEWDNSFAAPKLAAAGSDQ